MAGLLVYSDAHALLMLFGYVVLTQIRQRREHDFLRAGLRTIQAASRVREFAVEAKLGITDAELQSAEDRLRAKMGEIAWQSLQRDLGLTTDEQDEI